MLSILAVIFQAPVSLLLCLRWAKRPCSLSAPWFLVVFFAFVVRVEFLIRRSRSSKLSLTPPARISSHSVKSGVLSLLWLHYKLILNICSQTVNKHVAKNKHESEPLSVVVIPLLLGNCGHLPSLEKRSAIVAIILKPPFTAFIAITTFQWFPYDRNDCSPFFSSDHSDSSDHRETSLHLKKNVWLQYSPHSSF